MKTEKLLDVSRNIHEIINKFEADRESTLLYVFHYLIVVKYVVLYRVHNTLYLRVSLYLNSSKCLYS